MDKKIELGGGLAGLAIAAGAVAFGAFLSNRHKQRSIDSAPFFAKRKPEGELAQVGRSVTIRKPKEELFEFWRDFSNLAKFMENLEAVEREEGTKVTTWRIKAPIGQTVEIKSEILSEKKNDYIAWQSVEGSDIETRGKVKFEDASGDRGTKVSLEMAYDPPGGTLGRAAAKLFLREPQIQARHDLKRFKMLMETGEISTSARTEDETRAALQENG